MGVAQPLIILEDQGGLCRPLTKAFFLKESQVLGMLTSDFFESPLVGSIIAGGAAGHPERRGQ